MDEAPHSIVTVELPRRMTGEEIVRHIKHVVESSDRTSFVDEVGQQDGETHSIWRYGSIPTMQSKVMPGDNSEQFFRPEWSYSSIQVMDEEIGVSRLALWSPEDYVKAVNAFAEELDEYFKSQCSVTAGG